MFLRCVISNTLKKNINNARIKSISGKQQRQLFVLSTRKTIAAAPTTLASSKFQFIKPLSTTSSATTSTSNYTPELEQFTKSFLEEVKDVPHATDPTQSSKILRQLCKTELLKFTDMRDNPEKFFMAHRLLSTVGLGGFGIRFTVQFNLFAGSLGK